MFATRSDTQNDLVLERPGGDPERRSAAACGSQPLRSSAGSAADFAETIAGERAGQRLARAIQGKGAFRRFKDELHDRYPDLLPAWHAFRDARALRRAVGWLADHALISAEDADRFLAEHSDPQPR